MAADINVLPPMCPSNTETSPLTPFSAVAPNYLVPFSKVQIKITLETIYEEEEDDEEEEKEDEMEKSSETHASSSPPIFFPIIQAAAATCSFEITGVGLKKDMVKEVRGIQRYYGEVAPALLITPHKKCSFRFPRLEPIIEEGSDIQGLQIMPKRMLFLVPALISFGTYYFLLYSNVN
ncbi:hypothetical protein GmHk_05G013729 [Glycine max]|nr:hypothetical protein GmHk_05G013729 [Glycine max]